MTKRETCCCIAGRCRDFRSRKAECVSVRRCRYAVSRAVRDIAGSSQRDRAIRCEVTTTCHTVTGNDLTCSVRRRVSEEAVDIRRC
ncbi:hypothetical protein D9M69_505570 [compost metagenome]